MNSSAKLATSLVLIDTSLTNQMIKGASQGDPNMLQALLQKLGLMEPPVIPPDPEVNPLAAFGRGFIPGGYGRMMQEADPYGEGGYGKERFVKGTLHGAGLGLLTAMGLIPAAKGIRNAVARRTAKLPEYMPTLAKNLQGAGIMPPIKERIGDMPEIILRQADVDSPRPISENLRALFGKEDIAGNRIGRGVPHLLNPLAYGRLAGDIGGEMWDTAINTNRDKRLLTGIGAGVGTFLEPVFGAMDFNAEHDTNGVLGR